MFVFKTSYCSERIGVMKYAPSNRNADTSTYMEPITGNAPLGKEKATRFDRPVSISIHSQRNRLTDSDGACSKYVIDSLVSAGILQDDSPEYVPCSPRKTQEKVTGLERTIITITDE